MSELENIKDNRPEDRITRRELFKMASPLGKVELEAAQCTGCGLCARDCPTEALAFDVNTETDTYKLLFRHNLCVACGICLEICPEKCLRLERSLELDTLGSPAAILFEDRITRCSKCNKPTGTEAMMKKLKARLGAAGQTPAQFELCPECKVKIQFSRLRD